jgi:CheY-like chemotaxis protein
MELRIIIFEDDEATRTLLKMVVEKQGHQVLAFPDPTACPLYGNDQCTCQQDLPCGDLLITDNQMPRMTGLEFLRRQQERGCKGAPANKAIASASWTEAQLVEARRLGCKVFPKPFPLSALSAWIQEREITIPAGRRLADLALS